MHLGRRTKLARVEAIGEHAPAPAEGTVDPTCDARRETSRAARESHRAVGLHEKMEMVRLNRIVDDPKRSCAARAARRNQRRGHDPRQDAFSERRQAGDHAHRDVNRVRARFERAPRMRNPGLLAAGLAARAVPPTAPGSIAKLELPSATHRALDIAPFFGGATAAPPRLASA